MNYLLLLLAFLPIAGEITLDKYLWKIKMNDKPISTILRYITFLFLSLISMIIGVTPMWEALTLLVATHAVFFDPILNLSRGLKLFYHSKNGWWDRTWGGIATMNWGIPIYIWLRLMIYWIGFLFAFRMDLVRGEHIIDGTWWENISQFFKFI